MCIRDSNTEVQNLVAGKPSFYEGPEFQERIVVAVANCGPGKALKPVRIGLWAGGTEVSRREFAAWARQIDWEPPPELLAMADQQNTSTLAEGHANGERPAHNKRATEAKYLSWQEGINKLAQDSPGKSHADYCRTLSKQINVSFQTIRRNTKLGHS